MSKAIGFMKSVSIKSVWPNEERDFTPWLKEHGLKHLLEKIGIEDIKEIDQESRCGDNNKSEADLVVTYLDGEDEKTIVIENQYGKSDADHLGRLLMYSADKKASVIVWITEEEKQEYVKTINWLNENCTSDVQFYLVRISLFTIGDSLPAPVFDVLAQPTDEGTKVVAEKARSEAMDLCFTFWQSCLDDDEFMKILSNAKLRQRRANGDRWKDYSVGSSDVWLCASVTTKGGRIKTCFTLKNGSAIYERLMGEESFHKLEECIGLKPEKGQESTKTYSTINFYRNDVDIAEGKERQVEARKWFGEMLPKMKAFLEDENIIRR